jgi:hypothetical protein
VYLRVEAPPERAVEITGRALEIILPNENWAWVSRVYTARAKAHEVLGDAEGVAADRLEAEGYQQRVTGGK